MIEEQIQNLCRIFGIKGNIKEVRKLTNGHINLTYGIIAEEEGGEYDYVLQRINSYVFKNPTEVMENIAKVTSHIARKVGSDQYNTVYFLTANDGKNYYIDGENNFWRCSKFVKNTITFNSTDNLSVIEESGKAFGEFQLYLSDFNAKELNIVIPHFHNTVMRYEAFKKAIEEDSANRLKVIKKEVDGYLALEDMATKMYRMQKKGDLPLKVTHNDTKCNNVLFDKDTFEYKAVIDLDTVMPGLIGFDFGDAVRFNANTSEEDERDLQKVGLDMNKYEAFGRGFVRKVGSSLTESEKQTLYLGAITMTVECGMRFLTDYLSGDKYFGISYKEHNLVRSRCQLKLAEDMIVKADEMKIILEKYF